MMGSGGARPTMGGDDDEDEFVLLRVVTDSDLYNDEGAVSPSSVQLQSLLSSSPNKTLIMEVDKNNSNNGDNSWSIRTCCSSIFRQCRRRRAIRTSSSSNNTHNSNNNNLMMYYPIYGILFVIFLYASMYNSTTTTTMYEPDRPSSTIPIPIGVENERNNNTNASTNIIESQITPKVYVPSSFNCVLKSQSFILNMTYQNSPINNVNLDGNDQNGQGQDQNGHEDGLLLYQKTPKCGSTTGASIHLRIARNVAQRVTASKIQDNNATSNTNNSAASSPPPTMMCNNRWVHGKPSDPRQPRYAARFGTRDRTSSFLWTTIRTPTDRYLSHYFFGPVTSALVTANNNTNTNTTTTTTTKIPSVESFKQWLVHKVGPKRGESKNIYLCYLSTQHRQAGTSCDDLDLDFDQQYTNNNNDSQQQQQKQQRIAAINTIIQEYDFIGIVERYKESLVVLMMLLDLKMADILYISNSKSSIGGYTPGRAKDNKCLKIAPKPKPLSNEFTTYFQSQEWKDHICDDQLLYDAAIRSLDLTIEHLGKSNVEQQLQRFQEVLLVAAQRCGHGQVRMPCDGTVATQRPNNETGCLYRDIGCGMDCLDEVSTELNLW